MRRALFTSVACSLICLLFAPVGAADTYMVEGGQTLSEIAAVHGVTIDDLAQANNIVDVDFVMAGTVLTIPGHEGVYVVQAGDTLDAVAGQFGTSASALAQRNGIADPNFVVVGQRLSVPGASGFVTQADNVVGDPPADVPVPDPASRSDIEGALVEWAGRNGIDADLAKGLAWHESGWHQDVVSSSGAVGVMQLMPSAAVHASIDLIGVATLDRYDMVDNVRMGVRYLRQLLVNFEGDERLALASYYQGERAVREIGVYPESERFVANVLANRESFAQAG